MRKHNHAFLCLIVVLNFVAVNAYSAVTILNRTRSAWALNDKGGSGTSVKWKEYSAYAWQNTTISGNTLYANGGAVDSVPSDGMHYYSEWVKQSAGSSMKIEFNVSNPEYFLFNLTVNASVDFGGYCSPDPTHLHLSLFGDNGSIFYFDFYDAWIADGSSMFGVYEQFHESYLLDSGNYTLIAEASAGGSYGSDEYYGPGGGGYGGWASYNLQFSLLNSASAFNVIPAPGAILLAGFGTMLVGHLRRRRVL